MNAKNMIALLEYGKAFGQKEKPKRRRKKDPAMKFEDLPEEVLFMKLDAAERKADAIKQYIEQRAKMYKKEDKKEEKKGWEKLSFIQKITILTATVPVAMMAYSLLIILFIKTAARVMGL
jgi:hypothetical protein